MKSKIKFFGLDAFDVLSAQTEKFLSEWLFAVCESHGQTISKLHYFFVTDEALLRVNRDFLEHDYYTDIITFPYAERGLPIEGEIYISVDRIADNAATLGLSFQDEFHRVCVHGLLHLIGFDDRSKEQKNAMRKAEDKALILRTL